MGGNSKRQNVERVPDLVGRLYEVVSELEMLFPGRHFTLMGTWWEAWAR